MVLTFSKNPLVRLSCWIDNKREEWSGHIWKSKAHHAFCVICGKKISSCEWEFSPEESGWERLGKSKKWVCHQCIWSRDFTPFIEIIDEAERKKYEGIDKMREQYKTPEQPISPYKFKELMQSINDYKYKGVYSYNDEITSPESSHYTADALMCDLLSSLGYEDGIDIFRSMNKWYS